MKRMAVTGPQDYLAVVFRRKWWAVGSFLFLFAIIVFVSCLLPDLYVSRTLIQVESREVPDDFVRNLVTGSTEARLHAIQQSVLSRTNLVAILEEFRSELTAPAGLNVEERVELLKNRITIDVKVDRSRNDSLVPFLKISYEDTNPGVAQKVTQRLASLFIEYDSRNRQERASGAAEFFEGELRKVSQQLQVTSSNLRQLKEQYRYQLPGQLDANLRTLDRLQEQMKANAEALDRHLSVRLGLERQLLEQSSPAQKTAPVIPPVTGTPTPSGPVAQYRELERRYNALLGRYTERHPEVLQLKFELDRLGKKLSPEDLADNGNRKQAGAVSDASSAALYQNLSNQLREVKTEIGIRERERTWIQEEIAKYSSRVQNTPQAEQGIASILREYEELNKQYEELKRKLAEARLAESLETKQKGAQFVIVDQANYPFKPDKPNRIFISIVGFLMSVAFGFAVAVGVDLIDQKLWTQIEVEKLLNLPVLVEIPEILTDQEASQARKRRIAHAAAFVIVTSLFLSALYLTYTTPRPRSMADRYLTRVMEAMSQK